MNTSTEQKYQDYSPDQEAAINIIEELQELLKNETIQEAFEFCNEQEPAMIKVLGDSGVLRLLEELAGLCVDFSNDIYYEDDFSKFIENYELWCEIGVYKIHERGMGWG